MTVVRSNRPPIDNTPPRPSMPARFASALGVGYDAADFGCLTFTGRLKRFIKLGGEMISLPAIESVLFTVHARSIDPDKGPLLAVEATATDPPEVVLFSTLPLSRAEVNDQLRAAGLSGLHSIRRVIDLEAIPVLGTGKTAYRALKELLKQATGNGQQATGNG